MRVLQEEETIRRLGDTKDVRIDVRIITATHRDLAAEAKAGRFREDLYYRINVLPIMIPPLRARREDINLMIDHFLVRNNARLGTSIRALAADARKNCSSSMGGREMSRELENTIERAMVLCDGDVIDSGDLPERLRDALDPVQVQLATGELSVKKTTAAIEEILIRRALQKTRGNRTRAAELLGDQPPRTALQDQGLQDYRSMKRALFVFVVTSALTGAASARADGTSAQTAQAMFDEGRRLMASGQYAEACPKFVGE